MRARKITVTLESQRSVARKPLYQRWHAARLRSDICAYGRLNGVPVAHY